MASTGINVVEVTAPVLVGHIVHCLLYGALTVQCYLFYLAFPNDTRATKSLVLLLYVFDTAQFILLLRDNFSLFAKGFGNPEAFLPVGLSWLVVPVMTGIGSCGVQLFFCYRIWLLQKSKIMVGLISVVALMQCGAAMAAGVLSSQATNSFVLPTLIYKPVAIWLTGSGVCDIMIATALTYFLMKRNTAFSQTKVLISKLIRMSIETGLFTAGVTWLQIILFFGFPDKLYYTTAGLFMLKVYSNSCMAVLNSRIHITGGRNEASTVERRLSRTPFSSGSHSHSSGSKGQGSKALESRIDARRTQDTSQSVVDMRSAETGGWGEEAGVKTISRELLEVMEDDRPLARRDASHGKPIDIV